MTEATPRPWTDEGWDNFDPEELEPVRVIATEGNPIIAKVYSEATTWAGADADAVCLANAALIVAAVNADEAAQALAGAAKETAGFLMDNEFYSVFDKLSDALDAYRAARGENVDG